MEKNGRDTWQGTHGKARLPGVEESTTSSDKKKRVSLDFIWCLANIIVANKRRPHVSISTNEDEE